ncbi:uncharacterized protein LOC141527611 [Cotesia typhae]|uniref:uncharacterized protein LOC141527611 n=1 Tax=Cotesia typhae TaxID=2053667 RepID=UPI003D68D71F
MFSDTDKSVDLNRSLLEFDPTPDDQRMTPLNPGLVTQTRANNGNDARNNDGNTRSTQQQPTLPVVPDDTSHILAVNLNLPQFTSDRPEMWFAIAEADFLANRITSDNQRYSQTLKALQPNIQNQLWDIISKPPSQDKYLRIKTAILSRFSDSRQTQLLKLLRDMTLGDKKPSQLLREMRELARGSINDDALHQLWKERLPAWIRPYLLVSPHINDLNGLADLADRLVLSMGNNAVYAVHNRDHAISTGQSQLEQQMTELKLTMKSLQQDISNMQLQLQQQLLLINNLSQRKSRADQGYGRSQSRGRALTPNPNGYCYYHNRWENDSRKCVQPCKFVPTTLQNAGN